MIPCDCTRHCASTAPRPWKWRTGRWRPRPSMQSANLRCFEFDNSPDGTTDMNDEPVSKILVLDDSPDHARRIKQFCDENHLVPLRVRKGSVMSVLRTNIDLGGILYSETYEDSPEETARVALEIHAARSELPIIIRREKKATLA